jgi:hypothetical protein
VHVIRYTRARHLALLGLFAAGWAAIFVVVHYGFDGVSASIGLLAGWAMGLAIGLNARICEDTRSRIVALEDARRRAREDRGEAIKEDDNGAH